MGTTINQSTATLGGLPAGTVVLTLAGALPVEHLMPGDRIVTRDGARHLRGIEARVVPVVRMVRISDSALGVDRPVGDVLIAEDQPVLVRDWRAKAMAGRAQAVVRAGALADGDYVRRETHVGLRLFTLAFDAPAVVMAAGLDLCAMPARQTA